MPLLYRLFTLHCNIIEASPTAGVALWYFCHWQDVDGQGWVDLPIKSVATFLKRTPPTIKRWIEEGCEHGLFRGWVKAEVGVVRLFLASRDAVCLQWGLTSYGFTAKVEPKWLTNLKAASTDTALKAGQRQSVFAALKAIGETCKDKLRHFIAPESLISSWSYSYWANVIHGTDKRVYGDENFIPVGVSQSHVAELLGRDRRTITRRLNELWRESKKLAKVAKKQVVQRVGFTDKDAEVGDLPIYKPKQFVMMGQLFEMKCNIYDFPEIQLTSCRAARYFYQRKLGNQGKKK